MALVASKYRHKKTGGTYAVIGQGKLQSAVPLTDMAELVIYIGKDGSLWARPPEEFLDGRFEEVKS